MRHQITAFNLFKKYKICSYFEACVNKEKIFVARIPYEKNSSPLIEEGIAKLWTHQGCITTTFSALRLKRDMVLRGSTVSDCGENGNSLIE